MVVTSSIEPVRFTRLKWRVWIETGMSARQAELYKGSPVLNGGCGLKPDLRRGRYHLPLGFTRLKWRVWIETAGRSATVQGVRRFTRLKWRVWIETSEEEAAHLAKGGVHPS